MKSTRTTSAEFANPSRAQYEIQVGHNRKWFIKLINLHNGKTVLTGETYYSKFNAKRAAKRMARNNKFAYKEIA